MISTSNDIAIHGAFSNWYGANILTSLSEICPRGQGRARLADIPAILVAIAVKLRGDAVRSASLVFLVAWTGGARFCCFIVDVPPLRISVGWLNRHLGLLFC
jgi:hypothetical protein